MHHSRSSSHKRRGTASVEAIMMLPFFIVVYAGIYYMHGLYAGYQLALGQARTCAWDYAKRGCEGDPPPGCEAAVGHEAMAQNEEDNFRVQDILGQLSSLPLIGDVVEGIFGRPLQTSTRHEIWAPRTFAPRRRSVASHYFTLCNTVPQSWGDVAMSIFCEFMPGDFPGC